MNFHGRWVAIPVLGAHPFLDAPPQWGRGSLPWWPTCRSRPKEGPKVDGTTGSERVLAHIHTVERAMSGRLHGGDLKLMSWFVDRMQAAAEADSRTLDAYAAEGLDPVKAFRVAPPKTPAKFYVCETKPLRRLSDAGWLVGTLFGRQTLYALSVGDRPPPECR